MTNTSSINLSNKIDNATVKVINVVGLICEGLNIPWVIVGATARDLLMHHGYGAPVKRATRDLDFAIEVAHWDAFNQVKQKLLEQGFREGKTEHRLFGPQDEMVDIVPFGDVENQDSIIEWPPKGEVAMNVLGISEACAYAEHVLLCEETGLEAPVATPEGMILLKLIAWSDRAPDIRRKDAIDIVYILDNYERIPKVRDEVYESQMSTIMEEFGWDLTLGSAYLLGKHAYQIASEGTRKLVKAIINNELDGLFLEALIQDMKQQGVESMRTDQIFDAFAKGFQKV